VNGSSCFGFEGDHCDTRVMCGLSSVEIDSCDCLSGIWSCVQGPCNTPPSDGGMFTCPPYPVVQGDSCSAQQGGLACTGTALNCEGLSITVPCYCGGTRWSCQVPRCDAGVDVTTMCPADMPQPGGPCEPGIVCDYPLGTCGTHCICGSEARFVCSVDCDARPRDGTVDARPDASLDAGAFD
jgi:hypothetical protein